MRLASVEISVTELPHFERLVRLLNDAEDLARVTADEDLQRLVDECRGDLAELPRAWE